MLRILGAIEALECSFGAPEFVVASGISCMVGTAYCQYGIDKTKKMFEELISSIESLFSFDFYETNRGIMSQNETYRKLNDFYTLIKSGTSLKQLGIEDIKKIDKFLLNNFSFLTNQLLKIPCYTSVFDFHRAQEKIIPITNTNILKAGISVVPFMGPVEIDGAGYISTQNIQAVSSPFEERKSDISIFLDTLSENGKPPFMSSMYILIAADYMGTIELKRQVEMKFSAIINLWENPEYPENVELSTLFDEGFKTTDRHVKNLLKRITPCRSH